jgi:hypothetical protein
MVLLVAVIFSETEMPFSGIRNDAVSGKIVQPFSVQIERTAQPGFHPAGIYTHLL